MTARYSLADVAALVGEPTRAAILLSLLDGRELPASALSREARLSASATSLHLTKLTHGGLLTVRKEGRHRFFRLANAEVAHALEALGTIATARAPARSSSAARRGGLPERSALRTARTCYDHLAGGVSVAFADMLERERLLCSRDDRTYEMTPAGLKWFAQVMSIDVDALSGGRRVLARRCLDWTERRPHVAGKLGAAVLDRLLEDRWVKRTRDSRAVRITLLGQEGFERLGLGGSFRDAG